MNASDKIIVPTAGAGVGIRAAATVIDGFILMVTTAVMAVISGTVDSSIQLDGLPYFYSLLLGFCYYSYFEGLHGATPGKLLCGLKVVKTDGFPCDLRAAVVRTICRIIDGLFGYLVGAVLVWTSTRNQRLGDRLTNTMVIRVK
ncbi:hypothetical protein SCACP_10960 [Sporomusa carbonis]|uniref:RDD family protein n=1 Tax=Sporomusa carbonis TaxID=3076075 RepID=UPI003A6F22AF